MEYKEKNGPNTDLTNEIFVRINGLIVRGITIE